MSKSITCSGQPRALNAPTNGGDSFESTHRHARALRFHFDGHGRRLPLLCPGQMRKCARQAGRHTLGQATHRLKALTLQPADTRAQRAAASASLAQARSAIEAAKREHGVRAIELRRCLLDDAACAVLASEGVRVYELYRGFVVLNWAAPLCNTEQTAEHRAEACRKRPRPDWPTE